MNSLEDKVVIITGASSGIGEAAAKKLAASGACVVLGARRIERLEQIASEIGAKAAYLKADVTSIEDMRALVALAKDRFGHVDVMFANAGIMPAGNMSELNTDAWSSMVDVNINGVLNAIAAVLPEFTEQKHGHVIATSSVAGLKSVPGNAVYCGTKHFVRAMMDCLRQESVSEKTNIKTTTLFPGAIKTELLNTVAPSAMKTAVEQFYEQVGIEPEAIADAVAYALLQPEDVDVSELVIRPLGEA